MHPYSSSWVGTHRKLNAVGCDQNGDKDKLQRLQKQRAVIEKYIASKAQDGGAKADGKTQSERGMGPWAWGATRRVEENSALLGGGIGRDPADSDQRIRFFDEEKNRLAAFFEPDLVYSFDFVGSCANIIIQTVLIYENACAAPIATMIYIAMVNFWSPSPCDLSVAEESLDLKNFILSQGLLKLNFGKCMDGQPLK